MTDGIAHEMHQRIHHSLDEKLVDLRFAAAKLYDDLLAVLARKVAHHKSHSFKDLADLDHAHPHDALAQISQLPGNGETRFLQRTPDRGRCHAFQLSQLVFEPCATDHQFADDAHQFVEAVELHAHHSGRRNRRHGL